MAVSPALTVSERAALNGVSTLARYLSPVPDSDVATARINQSSFVYPLAQITVDTTSGWSDVRAGDTVFVGTSAAAHDVGVYRVRLTPGGSTLYLGETSSQDVGQLPMTIRTAAFANDQYITVKRRFDLWSVLPVINPTTGAIYEDYNLSVGTFNTTPPPLVNVVINNRRNHFATLIADGSTLALTASAAPTSWPPSAGEGFTYLWTTPASGWSSISGATSATLTATVAPGTYILYLSVTGASSGVTKRACYIHVHDSTTTPPLLISEMPRSDVRDRTGRRMSFDLYANRLESVPDGAACLYFEMATWANQWENSDATLDGAIDDSVTDITVSDGSLFVAGDTLLIDSEQISVVSIASNTLTVTRAFNGTSAAAHEDGSVIFLYAPATDVPTATRQMVGWVQRQDKSTGDGLKQATIDLVSPSFVLGLLNSTSQIVQSVVSPATWQEVVPSLSTSAFLTWYMLQWRCANVLLLFNYTPFGVSATGQRLPSWVIDKGTVLQQIQNLVTERSNFGCNSEGEFFYLHTPQLINDADRGSVVVRDTLTASLYAQAGNPRDLTNRVQQVRGEAFSWDGSALLPTPYYSDAPTAPGQGTSQTKLPAQVVTGQSELNQLTGDQYARLNNPYSSVTVKIKTNRDVYEPAEMAFVNLTIPAVLSSTGLVYQSNIIPLSVNKTHNADGTSDIDLSGEGETHNLAGTTVPVPVPNDSLYTPDYVPIPIDPLPLPSLGDYSSIIVPASVPSPQGATVSPGKGAIWVSADGNKIKRTLDISIEPPLVDDVTPSDTFFTDFAMVVHDKSKNFSRAAYALGNDGTNSKVAYTTDIYADSVVWTTGGTLTGLYTQIESAGLTSLVGGVVVYCPNNGITVDTTDFTASDGGFTALTTGYAAYHVGEGWGRGSTITINENARCGIQAAVGDYVKLRLYFNETLPDSTSFAQALVYSYPPYTPNGIRLSANTTIVDLNVSGTGGVALDIGSVYPGLLPVIPVTWRLTRLDIYRAGSGDAVVSTSDDYGATWSDQTVGTSALHAEAAFCLSRFGVVALAAIDATLKKATAFGGSFGSVTGGGTTGTYPIAARIPWFKIGNKSKTNNSSSPDFYLASAAAISTESLWKVIGGTKTAITPAVSGTKALGPTSNSLGTYSANRVCFIGDISGTRYLFASSTSGASWGHTAMSGAMSVRAQRFSPSGLIWIAATTSDIQYSDDGGVTWNSRTVSGASLFCELFG